MSKRERKRGRGEEEKKEIITKKKSEIVTFD